MKRKYNKQHCDSKVRAVITIGESTISLVGTHAFEWSIVREESGKIIITTFDNRIKAKDEWDRLRELCIQTNKRFEKDMRKRISRMYKNY